MPAEIKGGWYKGRECGVVHSDTPHFAVFYFLSVVYQARGASRLRHLSSRDVISPYTSLVSNCGGVLDLWARQGKGSLH